MGEGGGKVLGAIGGKLREAICHVLNFFYFLQKNRKQRRRRAPRAATVCEKGIEQRFTRQQDLAPTVSGHIARH